MFKDYLTLMLVNMVAAQVMLALLLIGGLDAPRRRVWAPGLFVTGLVALITGAHMTLTWPIPSVEGMPFNFMVANVAFGEPTLALGALLWGVALALVRDWRLVSLGVFSFFLGGVALLVGIYIINNGITTRPIVAGLAFVLAGVAGVLALPATLLPRQRIWGIITGTVLLGAAALFGITGYVSYWRHLERYATF